LYLIFLPVIILLAFKKKYKNSIPARFFLINNPPFKEGDIWFHACSFGEVSSLKPLIERVGKVHISVITATGYEKAKEFSSSVRFLPFEIFLPFWAPKVKTLVVTEAELWPMLFVSAKAKGAKTILINARISDNSYKNYMRTRWLYSFLFSFVDLVFCQSQKDKERLQKLGAKNVKISPNIKSFQKITPSIRYKKPKEKVITLASTHKTEEKLLLESFDFQKGMKIIVVPRHPERFDEVDEFLKEFAKSKGLSYQRLRDDFKSDIILVDKMGELINIYAISDIVLLGGSFVEGIGGHNPLEPASFGCKLISGKHIFNQHALFEMVENALLIDISELREKIRYEDSIKRSRIISSEQLLEPLISEILE